MSKLDVVNEFYTKQLNDVSLVTADTGMVSFKKDDELKPLTIGGKRVVIATKPMLKEADWEHRIAFHPLSEQFSVELSPILNAFKNYIQVSLATKLGLAAQLIANFAADSTRHKGSNKRIGEVLKDLASCDVKTAGYVKSILKATSNAPEKRLVNVLLKNSEGTYLRSCVITFPILEAIEAAVESGKNEILGVKNLRNDDMTAILNLFRYICGEKLIAGSNDRTAPYYESLLLAWHSVATRFNDIHDTWKTKLPEFKTTVLPYELEWGAQLTEGFATFAEKHHAVAPPLPGNRPVIDVEEVVEELTDRQKRAFENDNIALEEPRASSRRLDSEPSSGGGRTVADFLNRNTRSERGRLDPDLDRYARRDPPRRDRERDRDSRFETSRSRSDSGFTRKRSIKDF